MILNSSIPQIYRLQFKLGQGSLKMGFPHAQLQLHVPGGDREAQVHSVALPPAEKLSEHWQRWRDGYSELAQQKQSQGTEHQTRLELNIDNQANSPTNFSKADWDESYKQLLPLLKDWLMFEKLDQIERQLIKSCSNADEIHIEIELENLEMCQFPWHRWRFLDMFPRKAEVSYTLSERRNTKAKRPAREQIRVLVIIGDATRVDIQGDLEALNSLQLEPVIHYAPSRKKFQSLLRDPQGWDILFYGGHSQTRGGQGQLFINATESISLEKFSDSLSVAVERGLQLAFFNSCDGMGLAKTTSELGLPATLMMALPVPNGIAVSFAKYFLESFRQGHSCYMALAQARAQLQEMEKEFLCASWIPALFRNGTVEPPTWQDIQYGNRWQRRIRQLKAGLAIALGVSAAIVGISSQGWLEPLELKAYDWMLRHRPSEGADSRILLVKVTPEDREELRATYGSWGSDNFLPDEILAQLLPTLRDRYQAVTIGIDFQQHESPFLTQWMQNHSSTYAVYGSQRNKDDNAATQWKPPKDVPALQLGFGYFPPDPDQRTRRLVFKQWCKDCPGEDSFPLQLALNYLHSIEPEKFKLSLNERGELILNDLEFTPISRTLGGYTLSEEDVGGAQLMLNYRAGNQVAESLTLSQILKDELSEEQIQKLQNRLVIVGGVIRDRHPTPYALDTTGIEIQAHIVSQILSADQEQRAFITGIPDIIEGLFVGGAALLIIPLFWFQNKTRIKLLLALTATDFICVIGYVSLCHGVWIPIIAPALSLTLAFMLAWGYQLKQEVI